MSPGGDEPPSQIGYQRSWQRQPAYRAHQLVRDRQRRLRPEPLIQSAKLGRIGPAAGRAADQDHQLADTSIADSNAPLGTCYSIMGPLPPAQPPALRQR